MRVLIRAGLAPAILLSAVLARAPRLSPGRAAANGSGSCYPVNLTWICVYSGGGGGGSGSGGGSGTVTCTYAKAPPGVLERTGTGPPAPGYQWDIMTCPGSDPGSLGGQLVQVNIKSGTPAVTPFDLLKIAIGELSVPTLAVRHRAAARQGRPGRAARVVLGAARSVARRQRHRQRRAGLGDGDGRPHVAQLCPGRRHGLSQLQRTGHRVQPRAARGAAAHAPAPTPITQPSKGQPGNAFQAGLFVTWKVSWTGSGGAGGLITAGYTTGNAFAVRVAQAEALVTTP